MAGWRENMRGAARLAPYLGYGLCYAWVFCFSAIYEFGTSPSLSFFLRSTAPGIVAAVAVVLLAVRRPRACRALTRSFVPALLSSFGTLLFTLPSLSGTAAHDAGMAFAGALFVVVIVRWGELFAALPHREVIGLTGLSGLVTALLCYGVSWLGAETAAFVVALLPLVSYAAQLACGDVEAGAQSAQATLASSLRGLPWKVFPVMFAVFFARNASVLTQTVAASWLGSASAGCLAGPLVLAAVMLFLALRDSRERVAPAGSTAADTARPMGLPTIVGLLLLVVATPVMLVAGAASLGGSLAFGSSIAVDVLAWTVLVLAAQSAPVPVAATLAAGWTVQMLGGLTAYLLAPLAQASTAVYLFCAMALLILAGASLLTGMRAAGGAARDVLEEAAPDRTGQEGASREPGFPADADAPRERNRAADARMRAFCAERDLSPREEEVFALWVTGHGIRAIQERLGISESTVKTHVRHLYEKCGVPDKPALIAAWEEWDARDAEGQAGGRR